MNSCSGVTSTVIISGSAAVYVQCIIGVYACIIRNRGRVTSINTTEHYSIYINNLYYVLSDSYKYI